MGEAKIRRAANERAQLERAAKAGGITLLRWNETMGAYETPEGLWNAHADDGDAFRLAAKLRLMIEVSDDGHEARADAWTGHHYTVLCEGDEAAALRHAIVCCAAAMERIPR